jgi:NADPH-dependent ferric siderophore reductase
MSAVKRAILGFVGETFLTAARVAEVTAPSEHFRFIDLVSKDLVGTRWRPGDKVQINVGDWNVRTYTPLSIDAVAGRLRILAFAHGAGPGSIWARAVKADAGCHLLGPRGSLALGDATAPTVLFGDETSFAVASNLETQLGTRSPARFVFEVTAPAESRLILEQLGLAERATLVDKRADGSHLDAAARAVRQALAELATSELVLTGNAGSIQRLRKQLKNEGVSLRQSKTKAYWAHGKEGLD